MRSLLAALGLALGLTSAGQVESRPLRVLSLDQCADQFALGLAAEDSILFLSPRADDPDSRLRALAKRHARVRPGLEAALAARPDVVLRYWGGDPRLLRALSEKGARVVTIEDATDLDGVRRNVRSAAESLGRADAGEARLEAMQADLDRARSMQRGEALYLTAGGFTAGPGTLIDSLLRAAGFRNAVQAWGFGPVSLERLILEPPARLVLGFFELTRSDWRGAGRHAVVRSLARRRPVAHVRADVLGCPAWFAGEAVRQMGGGQ